MNGQTTALVSGAWRSRAVCSSKTLAAMSSSARRSSGRSVWMRRDGPRDAPGDQRRGRRVPRPDAGSPRAVAAAPVRVRRRWPRRGRRGRGDRPRARRPGARSGRGPASAARAGPRSGCSKTSRSSSPTHSRSRPTARSMVDRELDHRQPQSSSRLISAAANGSPATSSSGGPRPGRAPHAGARRPCRRSNRVTSRSSGPSRSSSPRPHVRMSLAPSALRSCDTCRCTASAPSRQGLGPQPADQPLGGGRSSRRAARASPAAHGLARGDREYAPVDAGLHRSQESDVHSGPPADTPRPSTEIYPPLRATARPGRRDAARSQPTEGVDMRVRSVTGIALMGLAVSASPAFAAITGRSCSRRPRRRQAGRLGR